MYTKKLLIVLLLILFSLTLVAYSSGENQPTLPSLGACPELVEGGIEGELSPKTGIAAFTSLNATDPYTDSIYLPIIIDDEQQTTASPYTVVDTGQSTCYDNQNAIACPLSGASFYGQDAQYAGVQPSYVDNGDGTVTDLNTGLMWQQNPGEKMTYAEAAAGADTFNLAGYDDWRLPTVKELYSLIDFRGSSISQIPYIDTDYFGFRFGDPNLGERNIDSQYWTSTEYLGTVFGGQRAVFGVNFADGRIKGYPRDTGPSGQPKTNFVLYVRGNLDYGLNNFVDNGDGTITDLATGLMWQKADSGTTMNWEQALVYAENLEVAGYDDWRLPNAKELQSIVDYSRAPDAQDPAQQGPAIDPLFDLTETESWFWTGTTLLEGRGQAVYVTFGQAFGVYNGTLVNVHGAGAQRSDPKSGNPADWADGFGPQNDQIRIYNYVRAVRDGGVVAVEESVFNPTDQPSVGSPPAGGTGQPPTGAPSDSQGEGTGQPFGSHPANAPEQPSGGGTPPQEAIEVCSGASQNNPCEMTTPHGMLTGTCLPIANDQLACVPQGGPPSGSP